MISIIERIDPEQLIVGDRKAGVLQAHERHMIDKWEIPSDPRTSFAEARSCDRVEHDPQLNSLTAILQLEHTKNSLIKCPFCLHYVVVDVINR
ncbi:hypothetical protein A5625_10730 [Mycobacterium sp. 1465703.0]|nr:hypothetical protein A5625_10730 [Mycobacterium sp. 1465703.0]